MDAENIERIARGLSRWAKEALVEVRPIFDGDIGVADLILEGLVSYNQRWFFFGPHHISITPLGLAVRQWLKENGYG